MHTHLEPRQCGMSRRKLQESTRVCMCVHVWVCVHQRARVRNRASRSGDVFLHEAIDLSHPQPSLCSYTHTTPAVHTRSHTHLCTCGRHVTQIRQRFRGPKSYSYLSNIHPTPTPPTAARVRARTHTHTHTRTHTRTHARTAFRFAIGGLTLS